MEKRNEILELSIEFALSIIDYCELLEEKRKYVIARQLLSSGTSIGANVNEAQNAESDADFVHKLKIAAKETDETGYWLELCSRSKYYPDPEKLTIQLLSIKKLLTSIISTMKRKQNNKYKK